jgi:hypothetical protein
MLSGDARFDILSSGSDFFSALSPQYGLYFDTFEACLVQIHSGVMPGPSER